MRWRLGGCPLPFSSLGAPSRRLGEVGCAADGRAASRCDPPGPMSPCDVGQRGATRGGDSLGSEGPAVSGDAVRRLGPATAPREVELGLGLAPTRPARRRMASVIPRSRPTPGWEKRCGVEMWSSHLLRPASTLPGRRPFPLTPRPWAPWKLQPQLCLLLTCSSRAPGAHRQPGSSHVQGFRAPRRARRGGA